MNDLPSIPWGKIFSNFIWILGTSIILAAYSYHEFLAYLRKTKRTEVFNRTSFKKPLLLGLVLVTAGVSLSIDRVLLALISGIIAILLLLLFFKTTKSRAKLRQ